MKAERSNGFAKSIFPRERIRDIAVPSCWELMEKDYEGVAFYRHAFKVPANWAGKTVRLHFDAVNFRSEVWLNDTAVGMHEGGFTPFEFRVDDLLKFDGENTLMLRVVGPILMQDKRVDGMGPMETPQWRGAITGGIWQPVRLIATGDIYVKDVFIEPNKATFFEGLYPVKLAYPDSREMAIREIQLAKDAGFNMIRPWRKPPPPMWLDLADEMGVLTVGSLAVECMDLPIESASLSGWVENEVRESILRDRNRTCVVQWELFNEVTERQPNLQRLLHPVSVLARQLDPMRLILDESGGWRKARHVSALRVRTDPVQRHPRLPRPADQRRGFPDYDLRKRHYIGPGDTWWGADLAIVPLGKGRCIASQLRLLENLGKDPVADRLLLNMIRFTLSSTP